MSPKRSFQAYVSEIALLGVGLIWGSTFPVVKIGLASTGALWFNAYRFLLAAALAALILVVRWRTLSKDLWRYALLLGSLLAVGYTAQTVGLAYTTSGKAGFITGLFVVFVPLLGALAFRRRPSNAALFAVFIAVVGLALLSLNDNLTFNPGDPIVLICAVAYAVHILIVDKVTTIFDTVDLTMAQVVVAGIEMGILAYLFEPQLPQPNSYTLIALFITAVLATIVAFFVQIYAQKHIGPTRTALILLSEPVFAAVFGYLLLQEVLSLRRLAGAALILAGMVIAELYGREKAVGNSAS